MKKIILPLLLMVIVGEFAFSQGFDSTATFQKATVVLDNGKKIDGYIPFQWVSPQLIEKTVRVSTPEYYKERKAQDKTPKYSKLDKYKAKDLKSVTIDGYGTFVRKKYADLTEVGMASIPHYLMIKRIAQGDLEVFMLYALPGPVNMFKLSDLTAEEKMNVDSALVRNSKILIAKKDDEVAKDIANIKIDDYIKDKPAIYTAYKNDVYDGAKGAFGSKLKMGEYEDYKHLDLLLEIVNDYNAR